MNEPAPSTPHEGSWAGLARSLVAGAVGLAVFASLAAALLASATRVPGPSGWTFAELGVWLDRQPVGAAFQGLAAIGLTVVGYLTVSTVAVMLAAVAAAARVPRLARVAEVIAVPVLRRTIAAVLGLGLTVTNPAPAHAAPTPPQSTVATMRALDPAPALDDDALAVVEPEPTWTISAGDHLWGLAAGVLTRRLGPVTDRCGSRRVSAPRDRTQPHQPRRARPTRPRLPGAGLRSSAPTTR